MAFDSDNKSSAELQREIEQQRNRVENTIDEIQEKLSPGQLVDELLAYTKGGGGEFVSSLQRNVVANPLPVALLGVSLAWLMAKPVQSSVNDPEAVERERDYTAWADDDHNDVDYPLATISGYSLQRVGQTGEDRDRYSEFIDDSGRKFRARTDAQGRRAGHFIDDAGNRFRGFADAAGQRIDQIRDEAGNLLDEASGWASHTWQMTRGKMHDARHALHAGQSRVGAAGVGTMGRLGSLNETVIHQFRDQPLVGGALAFALGAALGSTLPHTPQEDAVLGEAADAMKVRTTEQTTELYEEGKQAVADAHEAVTEKAGEIHQQMRDVTSQPSDHSRT